MSSDWYGKLDRKVRRFGGDLPVDAFLPELDDRASAPAAKPAPGVALDGGVDPEVPSGGPTPEDLGLGVPFSEREPSRPEHDDSLGAEDPQEPPKDPVEDEIRAFMNRTQKELSEDDDLAEFLGNSIDPNID